MEDLLITEHSSWKVYPPSIDNSSYMDYPASHFYKENFNPPSMIFKKSQFIYIKKGEEASHYVKPELKTFKKLFSWLNNNIKDALFFHLEDNKKWSKYLFMFVSNVL